MRTINILCDGGLGNRLNALIGGLILSETLHARTKVFWPQNNWCGCSFGDLFAGSLDVSNQGIRHVFSLDPNSAYLIHENQINAPLRTVINPTQEGWAQLRTMATDVVYYHNSIPGWITRDQILKVLQSLPIQSAIAATASDYCKENRIGANTWGIQFRKTDYASHPAFSLDSDDLYKYIKADRRSRYYVSSDDLETEAYFSTLDNVRVYPKTSSVGKFQLGEWNDRIIDDQGRESNFNVNRPRQSVIEAFVSLLILSQTALAFESPSTFLTYAKLYKNFSLNDTLLKPSWQRWLYRQLPSGPRRFRIRRKLRALLS
jgi:hypothetical protein